MKNLIIPNTPPVASNRTSATSQAPAQTPANNAAQTAEPFNKVLARQNANAKEHSTDTQDGAQPSSSSTDSATTAPPSASSDSSPAANLPAADSASSALAEGGKKPVELQVQAADAASTLPGDMLAAWMPVAPSMPQDAAAATKPQSGVQGIFERTRESMDGRVMTALLRAEGKIAQSAAAASNSALVQGNAFAAPTETLGREAANMTLFNSAVEQVSAQAALTAQTAQTAQTDTTAAMSGLAQVAATPAIASTNGPAQAVINTPVTSRAWGDEFNQKVTWLATQHEQSAELHLNPPHLGPLDVVIKVSGDQATALFTSQHAAVRDAVEQALPKLREMMADNGIMLGNAMVSDQSPKEQQKWSGSFAGRDGRAAETASAGILQAGGIGTSARIHQGMVDTFA